MQHWDPLLIEKLSVKNKLIISDYRGMGASDGRLNKSTQQTADDVVNLMNSMKIKKANILGWSLGSFVAQTVAESYPDRVNKLILISTSPGGEQEIDGSADISNSIQQNLGGSWEKTYTPFFFATEQARKEYLTRLKWTQLIGEVPSGSEVNVQAKIAQEQALSKTSEEHLRSFFLSYIKSPTLLIAGTEDKLLPPENSTRTASHIPNSRVIIMQQAGHAVLFEKASEAARLIDEFLAQK